MRVDAVSCAICETRKEKRFCPAVHGKICAVCCGTEREVTLDCPSDCSYLQEARKHEKPRGLSDEDRAALFPRVEVKQTFVYEREPLVVGLSYAIVKAARSERGINDRDAIAALTALARKYEMLSGSGLVYEPQSANILQQRIADEMEKMVAEYRELEQKHVGYATLRDSEVLQALVFIVRMAYGRTSGRPRSRAFLEFLFQRFPEKEAGVSAPQGSSLIIP
ncbi:MAG TPA: hypothetical protein VMS96_12025 [Terriglobales bacterium]|nr:hypothetical protein [Terriglobales bacterium]